MPVKCTASPKCPHADCPHAILHDAYLTWYDDGDWRWCSDVQECARVDVAKKCEIVKKGGTMMTPEAHLATLQKYYDVPTLRAWITQHEDSENKRQCEQVARWRRVLATLEQSREVHSDEMQNL